MNHMTINKVSTYFTFTFSVLFVGLITIFPLYADEGQLLEEYPPNVIAENIKLSDLAGDLHELEDYRGKLVLVNFWSMSCNVCKSEMTTLQSAYDLLERDDFVIISVHAGDPSEDVESVLKLNNIHYPVVFDLDLQLGDWGIPVLPTSFIVSPKGDVRYRAVGMRVWNSPFMIDFMKGLLDSGSSSRSSSKPL
ncbi:MAG: TlpA disulfide reductase family protein [Gammaproteobacteria bacterium]